MFGTQIGLATTGYAEPPDPEESANFHANYAIWDTRNSVLQAVRSGRLFGSDGGRVTDQATIRRACGVPPRFIPRLRQWRPYPFVAASLAIARIIRSVPSSRSASFSKSPVTTMRMSGRTLGAFALRRHPLHQPGRIGEGIVAERDDDALRPGVDLFDMRLPAERLDRDELHQLSDLRRQRSETVDHLGGEALDLPRPSRVDRRR